MKPALVEDYSDPTLRALARGVLSSFLLEKKSLPFVCAFDASALHFKKWSAIVFNPKVKSAWKAILEKYYETDAYKKLNNAVAGDPLLAKYATIHFLNALFKEAGEVVRREKVRCDKCDVLQRLDEHLEKEAQQNPAYANKVVESIVSKLEKEAGEILEDLEAAESFSHVGAPIAQLLEKPEEFREKARNKIVVVLTKLLRKMLREAPSPRFAKTPTLVGGRPLGVKKLQRWSELTAALPMEYIDDSLMEYRIASRTLRVSERYGFTPDFVVYLDKSGSMAEEIKYRDGGKEERVPKISFAAAVALATAHQLRKHGARLTLKLFDVDVHDPIADFKALIDTLLRIKADSGTNITRVLEDAVEKHRNEKVVLITDGIDEVGEEAVRNAKSANLDLTVVFIKTDNELLRKNFRCVRIDEAKTQLLSILLEV